MRFGLFYEHQVPRPWDEDSERRVLHEALEQVELADRLGVEHVWEVEHHFLEEYSHAPAPEVFLAACSQRAKRIRLGHGIALMPPGFNHPARVAERIAVLDLVSNGRVEWGTGESTTALELGGFGIDPAQRQAMWQETSEQAANLLAMTPYPGFRGRYFEMPCRNLVPKPHPPLWLACSRRESIHRAARMGLGVLAFAFVEPEQAASWVDEYDAILKSEACVPLGHVAIFGQHRPCRTDVWQRFVEAKDSLPDDAGRGGIGTPAQVCDHLERYERAGVDQVIFVQQCGRNRHEREALAPYVEAALARKRRMPPLAERAIPTVDALGRALAGSVPLDATSGGAIPIPVQDPAERPYQS